jgi:hypothetical protein
MRRLRSVFAACLLAAWVWAPVAPVHAHPASSTTSPPVAGATITLDVTPGGRDTVPVQLMVFNGPKALGMSAVPDMHTAVLQQPDGSYRLWIAGRFLDDSIEGSTGLITTSDFQTFQPGPLTDPTGKKVAPDFVPTCRGATESTACWNNFDAVYTGADLVWKGTDGDLRMLYHGACGYFGGLPPDSSMATWCQVGVARSSDGGVTWGPGAPVISGSEPKPTSDLVGIFGAVEPGGLIAGGYLYCFYAYFPIANPNHPVIQVARAPLSGNGAPGTWQKYWNGSFSEPGLLGGAGTSLGAQVVPTIAGCTRPAQPWPVFSTYLNAWVLVYLGKEGWFFTTSTDLVNWNVPVRFFPFPGDPALSNFTNGAETYENVILVTAGNPEGVIGQTGLVLYAYTPSWGHNAHMLWSRPFRFDLSTAGVGPGPPAARHACELIAVAPDPVRERTTISYRLAAPGPVVLGVFDLAGRRVLALADQTMPAGTHEVPLDAAALAPGVYECRVSAGGEVSARRFVRLR